MRIVLIQHHRDSWWQDILERVLPSNVDLVVFGDIPEDYSQTNSSALVVIVDSTMLEQLEQSVVRWKLSNPATEVVVVSSSPTWRRAKVALRAGASDYIAKDLPELELRAAVRAAIDRAASG